MQRLKWVGGDLVDLWLYEGSKGLAYLRETSVFKKTDDYLHYDALYEQFTTKSVVVSDQVLSRLSQANQQLVMWVDETRNFVGMLIKVVKDRQAGVVDYVRSTYSSTQVFVHENWMRLDFNNDGAVSLDDLRTSLVKFYDFLKNYDYIEATVRIRSTVYEQAVKVIRA